MVCLEKKIAGDYYLQKVESGNYYLRDSTIGFNGISPIEGTVLDIGWNETIIIANRKAHFAGDGNGWMVIEVNHKIIKGPLSKEELLRSDVYKNIKFYSVTDAWNNL